MERRFSARSKQGFESPSQVVMNDDRRSITLFLDVATLARAAAFWAFLERRYFVFVTAGA